MEIEPPNIRFCPYWRKFVVSGDGSVLALCGAFSTKRPRIVDSDIGSSLGICPFYGESAQEYAFESPAIIESKGDEEIGIFKAYRRGQSGIRYLEKKWEEKVNEFRDRHKSIDQ